MDTERIEALLRDNDIFGKVGPALMAHLIAHLEPVSVPAGDEFMRQGETGDGLYLVVSGRYEVFLPGTPQLTLHHGGAGDVVGELGLLTHEPRSASVRALADLELMKMSRAVFDDIGDDHPGAFNHIKHAITERLRHMRIEKLIRASGLFGEVDEATLADLESRLKWISLLGGERLMAAGDSADALWILVHGRLAVSIDDPNGTRKRLTEVKPGESVGEIGVVTGRKRGADVYALRDSELVELSREHFFELVDRRPRFVVENIAGGIVERLADQIHKPGAAHNRELRTLAVLPLHQGVDLHLFCRRLDFAFGRLGSRLLLTHDVIDQVFGEPSVLDPDADDTTRQILSGWLNERETSTDHVLLEGEWGLTPWTQACLRQADQVLWLADASADPSRVEIHPAQSVIRDRGVVLPESLALLHGEHPPIETNRWLRLHDWHRHHHVRGDRDRDVERLSRFLTDRAVGLVFSGGAARGFAHIGVVRAMEESGIPIDCVAGVSMGAIMAALYAQEYDTKQMVEAVLALTNSVMDRTLPLVSVIKGRKFLDRLNKLFGDTMVEDLYRPSFYLSANLTQARVEVHDTGPLDHAVAASNAAPGLGPPVVAGGDLLVDGFVMNNLPVDRMRDVVHGGPVVAVDVMPPTDLPDNMDYGRRGLSGWYVLWSKLNPFIPTLTVPSIAEIIVRSHEINSVANQRNLQHQTRWYLQPPVTQYEMFEYSRGGEITEAAYDAVRETVASWADDLQAG